MSSKKIITVFGATGLQGGSVAGIFLRDPTLNTQWAVRAITRDVTKPAALKLAEDGAQVVYGDLDDKASLINAMRGSYAAFGVTNYFEKLDGDYETQQGKNIAEAAKEVGIQHYIWSSLLNIAKLSNGKLANVYHFDSKARVEDYVRSLEIPATFFLPGFYMSNIGGAKGFLRPNPPDGIWTLTLPVAASSQIPMFHVGDTGKFVKAIILHRQELLGARVLGATAYMAAEEVLETFKRLFPEAGKTARYFEIPEVMFREIMKSQGTPDHVITELYENGRLLEEFGYFGGEPLDKSHGLLQDHLTTWEEYSKHSEEAFKELK